MFLIDKKTVKTIICEFNHVEKDDKSTNSKSFRNKVLFYESSLFFIKFFSRIRKKSSRYRIVIILASHETRNFVDSDKSVILSSI